jgi:hypothetical protein
MPKKKKNQTQEGPAEAPVNDTVFPEVGAAQGAAAADRTTIPDDVAELIRATLKVLIAQRKLFGLSTTLTSLTKAVIKALDAYTKGIHVGAIREFVRREVEAMGYRVIEAKVNYLGAPFVAETVVLYRNFDEVVDVIKAGRADQLRVAIATDGIDPLFDKSAHA